MLAETPLGRCVHWPTGNRELGQSPVICQRCHSHCVRSRVDTHGSHRNTRAENSCGSLEPVSESQTTGYREVMPRGSVNCVPQSNKAKAVVWVITPQPRERVVVGPQGLHT